MAFLGIFGNYDKPGPGVNKDEPQKAAPVRFFEIFLRKFTKLVQLNLIFAIPATVAVALMVLIYLFPTHFMLQLAMADGVLQLDAWAMYAVPFPLVLLSPFLAGLTFVTRNFAREEHAFVWSDFWASVKNNWKLFLLNGIVCYLAYVILSFSILYYYTRSASEGIFYIPLGLCLVLSVLFVFAQYYLPVMFVTFDLKFRQAYKNAFIFSLAGLFRNLLLTVLFGGLLFVIIMYVPIMGLTLLIALFLYLFLVFALISFLINFTVYPLIDRFLIQPYQKKLEEEKSGGEKPEIKEEFSGLFAPDSIEEEEEDEDKFVYVNGKLVHKSELKEDDK